MPINTDPRYVGQASITPTDPVVAGQLGTWTITYEVGAYGYDEFARLKIASRFASDWGPPQFNEPGSANYTTVRLESRCPTTIAHLAWEPRGYIRPWFKCLVVSIRDGSLYPGDKIHVTIGDRSGGGPGSRTQTFREKGCELRVLVDPFGTELYSALAPSPQLDIVGGAIHRLVVVAPTTVRPGEPFEALVKAEDTWGNPCERFEGAGMLGAKGAPLEGLSGALTFRRGELAVARLSGLRSASAGVETRITAACGSYRAESNVIRALGQNESKTRWGDLHGQTRATVGTGTIEEYFAFGREIALLDMMCHQANDFQVTDEEWRRLRREIERFHENRRCVIFVGYEWSGRLGALRVAPARRARARLQGRGRRQLGRPQGTTGRQPSRRLDVRGLWRAHLRARRLADARRREGERPGRRNRADRTGRYLPRARPYKDGVALHSGIVRGLAALPDRLGGLARARAGSPDDVGRPRGALGGPLRRRRDLRDGEPGERYS